LERITKKTFIKDIKERDRVDDIFLVARKDMGMSKAGKPYLNLRFMDSTGAMDARAWDNAEAMARLFEAGDVVRARGYALSYRGEVQLNVSSIEKVPADRCSPSDFLPSSRRDPEKMIRELDAVIEGLSDPDVKALLKAVFADTEVRSRFKTAPAAKAMHHAFIGGLIEHVLSICKVVDFVVEHYRKDMALNRDILMAGAILHDIGKIYELSYTSSFDYTDEGKLIGHITLGVELVNRKAAALGDFPEHTRMAINHLILSHHGLLEFGSPKRPKMAEAIILSFLDDMDAKVAALRVMTDGVEEGANWTPYQRMFERPIYTGLLGRSGSAAGPKTEGGERTSAPGRPATEEETGSPAGAPEPAPLGELDLFKRGG